MGAESFINFVELAKEKKSAIKIKPVYAPITTQDVVVDLNPHPVDVIGWRYFVRLVFETEAGENYAYDRECGLSYKKINPNDEKELIAKTVNQAKAFLYDIKRKWPKVSAEIINA